MSQIPNLQRFISAQESSYKAALSEIQNGKKRSHWMWYIFPQIKGLGFSDTSGFYAIEDVEEAIAFLEHPVLGARLIEVSNQLLHLQSNDASKVFGSPDDLKLHSSMTLFNSVTDINPVFRFVLDKFFNGAKDAKTLQILAKMK